MKKIGILTGGGDCPGLNAVIRAVVKRAIDTYNLQVLGIREGWAGLIKGSVEPLTYFSISGILPRGGTILGTSRTNPFKSEEALQRTLNSIEKYGIDNFNDFCCKDVMKYASTWVETFKRIGRWVDFNHDYKTMDKDYMETILYIFEKHHVIN